MACDVSPVAMFVFVFILLVFVIFTADSKESIDLAVLFWSFIACVVVVFVFVLYLCLCLYLHQCLQLPPYHILLCSLELKIDFNIFIWLFLYKFLFAYMCIGIFVAFIFTTVLLSSTDIYCWPSSNGRVRILKSYTWTYKCPAAENGFPKRCQ